MEKILESLNNIQKLAVTTTEGPVLVLAGAGTGKTRVLTVRVSYIIRQRLAYPNEVLAVTFTNKAAFEMKERISSLLNSRAQDMWIGTFHSIGLRILRRHYSKVGLQDRFTILDNEDSQKVLKDILLKNNIDIKNTPAKFIANSIAKLKDKAIGYQDIQEEDNFTISNGIKLNDIYKEYSHKLKELNAVDFSDLLFYCLEIFNTHQDILELYQNKFKYILVDEYQDTNILQYKLLKMLSLKHNNICCVGDDDQSIYSWRGAEIANILAFQEDYSNAQVFRLEQNYRSTTPILETATTLISNNNNRWGKCLWTAKKGGEKILVNECVDSNAEAKLISDKINQYFRNGYSYSEIAILVRAIYQTRSIEEALLNNNIPYKIVGSNKFYERLEIKDALAYLRLCFQPNDNIAFERIINTPRRGIGDKALLAIKQTANEYKVSYYKALNVLLKNQYFNNKANFELSIFCNLIKKYNDLIDNIPVSELAEKILENFGYINMWRNERSEEAKIRLDNIMELLNSLGDFESLEEYLDHVNLIVNISDLNANNNVSIMTLHAAKGLEFYVVFLTGWEEGVFPSFRTISENEILGLEEERRLAYVGITRAKEHLTISYSTKRLSYNGWQDAIRSRFINELGKKHIQFYKQKEFDSTWNSYNASKNNYKINNDFSNKNFVKIAKYTIGSYVQHQLFGVGQVIKQEGAVLSINFAEHGEKKISADFVNKLN